MMAERGLISATEVDQSEPPQEVGIGGCIWVMRPQCAKAIDTLN